MRRSVARSRYFESDCLTFLGFRVGSEATGFLLSPSGVSNDVSGEGEGDHTHDFLEWPGRREPRDVLGAPLLAPARDVCKSSLKEVCRAAFSTQRTREKQVSDLVHNRAKEFRKCEE